ncbi:3-beta hydroxysteroid dehydrogenase [Microbacterium arborescens]|uniref:3-beta hydroxysteroid dehydrogenase n=1 Tax=Microbacterium arborescens TaxID=33883 RepID=A0ABX2WMQ4_9MICO|nr:NAD(P)H-binding protein [Microbacterium arborescens]OAZ45633.1 3-beta hydroxysteroid dehydrogenase [Microbacterium arborescens]
MRIAIAGSTGTVGKLVHSIATERGHDVVALARSNGHDLEHASLPPSVLDGVDTIVDVSGIQTLSRHRSRRFFESVSANLQQAGTAAGVGHLVALSIVGIDGVDAAYYGGKLAHERAVQRGELPHTLLRAAQFHEFAEQTLVRGKMGPITVVPAARVRPIAAREVAEHLVTLAEGEPVGRARDLTGPRDELLIDMVRALLDARGIRRATIEMRLPGSFGRAMSSGRLRGHANAERGTVTFAEWLAAQS